MQQFRNARILSHQIVGEAGFAQQVGERIPRMHSHAYINAQFRRVAQVAAEETESIRVSSRRTSFTDIRGLKTSSCKAYLISSRIAKANSTQHLA